MRSRKNYGSNKDGPQPPHATSCGHDYHHLLASYACDDDVQSEEPCALGRPVNVGSALVERACNASCLKVMLRFGLMFGHDISQVGSTQAPKPSRDVGSTSAGRLTLEVISTLLLLMFPRGLLSTEPAAQQWPQRQSSKPTSKLT